ncbi:hypothetical protein GQ42DRAFT_178448 [Ramicandelaber brevisporus]|nr:hypothetical protein GQ42DRAFT_178448 [Ramicandelaber brevisporus]
MDTQKDPKEPKGRQCGDAGHSPNLKDKKVTTWIHTELPMSDDKQQTAEGTHLEVKPMVSNSTVGEEQQTGDAHLASKQTDVLEPADDGADHERSDAVICSEDNETHTNGEPILTNREMRGWQMYFWAAFPVSVNASTYAAILLESLAAKGGVQEDYITPCDISVKGYTCYTQFGGGWVNTTSYALYINAISVLVNAVISIGCGAFADHGTYRKGFMLGFGVLGAVVGIVSLAANTPAMLPLFTALTMVSSICYSTSMVFCNAYLPTYTRVHPNVVAARRVSSALDSKEHIRAIEETSNTLAGHGFALGYAGSIITLIINVLIVYFSGGTTFSMQIALAVTGTWWLVWMLVPFKFVKHRPGPPLPAGESYIFFSFKTIWRTLRRARQLSMTFRFLIAWLFISDSVSTISTTAILFGKSVLGATTIQLAIVSIIVPVAALTGNILWVHIQRWTHLSTRVLIMVMICVFIVLPVYGLIGLSPNIGFGLKTIGEFYGSAVFIGLSFGSFQAFCRAQFAQLIPPGRENEFFSLFSVTDCGAAFVGPLIAGVIGNATGNLRYNFAFLLAILIIPLIIVATVDVQNGRMQAAAFKK